MKKVKKYLIPVNNMIKKCYRHFAGHSSQNEVFSRIHKNREWHSQESVSGYGSTLSATDSIRKSIPELIHRYNIKSFIDAPCGDLNWIEEVISCFDSYVGIDIVPEIIQENEVEHASANRRFMVSDVVNDPLPKADCIMVRDLFIHLPEDFIKICVINIIRSDISYLLVSNYPEIDYYKEIDAGECRSVNLLIKPFNFPPPIYQIEENWGGNGKNLSLYDLRTLSEHLKSLSNWKQFLTH